MAEQENTAVVPGIYESFKAGDIDAMLTGMTEDIEWQLPEIAGVPFSGKRQGHDSIREFFASVVELPMSLGRTSLAFYPNICVEPRPLRSGLG